MIIKKLDNGDVKLKVEPVFDILGNGSISENVYHDDMFMEDLYIQTIAENPYIIDFNRERVYDYFNSYMVQNPLKYLLEDLEENGEVTLIYDKELSEELMEEYSKEDECNWDLDTLTFLGIKKESTKNTPVKINEKKAKELFYAFLNLGAVTSELGRVVQNPYFACVEDLKIFQDECKKVETELNKLKSEVINLFNEHKRGDY